jgi:hypothetical protein
VTAPDYLAHAHDDCTGEWELSPASGGARVWTCTRCQVEHSSTEDNDRAARYEYLAGVQLRNQARRGRLGKLKPPPRKRGPYIELPDPDGYDP